MAQDPIINFLKKQTWISEVFYDGVIPEYDNYCYMISLCILIIETRYHTSKISISKS